MAAAADRISAGVAAALRVVATRIAVAVAAAARMPAAAVHIPAAAAAGMPAAVVRTATARLMANEPHLRHAGIGSGFRRLA
jgi:hypothetical protein